jgi:hypothetical protein
MTSRVLLADRHQGLIERVCGACSTGIRFGFMMVERAAAERLRWPRTCGHSILSRLETGGSMKLRHAIMIATLGIGSAMPVRAQDAYDGAWHYAFAPYHGPAIAGVFRW